MSAFTRVIATADAPDGEVRAVRLPGIEQLAVHNSGGLFFVTQDMCSHAKARLSEGWLEGFEICCPVHDGRFDIRDGRPLCFPAESPIRVFPCEVRDGEVWADLTDAKPE